ncbi:MAG: hypothetical protein COT39_00400 [Parcubacteria group bacterium CG08_land_8_20_14_0_20_48_21]|nr:MAG: hypothetical protein COT39_00400 [Parcubacteria group bacterium CG08_land_8_20_14_0_20_48_21]PIW79463.1 MAG: hypothetical protein COZ99_00915 [Parcubacteria group bacterium CG_4_8_14_3_um_filter_48_16]PIY77894.1 MAG: hypothetical protein COY83_02795 [Parcubacteria group bacterium CG_4_10_14_0_8_um_filter_48_154]PIZ76948.1 MAG: hypothetical protein COY03_04275 [bacterium CG_4_10_14_0_2_um_filter_48_144]PJC40206.1 MAG: hypothetical protein CO043_00080 [Parcubacteria group bacterium CG_4_9
MPKVACRCKLGYHEGMFKDFFPSKKSISPNPTVLTGAEDALLRPRAVRFVQKDSPVAYEEQSFWESEDFGGSLAVDVAETEDALFVHAPMAGVDAADIRVGLSGDLLTVRGVRRKPKITQEARAFHEECYWGNFSRSIVLPVAVEESRIRAELVQGVLEIILPKKAQPKTETVITVRGT